MSEEAEKLKAGTACVVEGLERRSKTSGLLPGSRTVLS